MLSVKLRRHKPTRFFSDELQALILIRIAVYFTYSKYTIIQMCSVGLLLAVYFKNVYFNELRIQTGTKWRQKVLR